MLPYKAQYIKCQKVAFYFSNIITKPINTFKNEQDYFEYYNSVKDNAINAIKESEGYKSFQNEDMNKFAIKNQGYNQKDIYKSFNIEKYFISIDIKKTNFSALYAYDKSIFNGANTYEEFISQFTDKKHIIESKYIRQVIFGNCNCKRHINYEKYLLDQYLTKLLKEYKNNLFFSAKENTSTSDYEIVMFTNDEIIIRIDNSVLNHINDLYDIAKLEAVNEPIPLRIEAFKLLKIEGTDGYIKKIIKGNNENTLDIKCLSPLYYPFVMRILNNQSIKDIDRTFIHEGLLTKIMEDPKIRISDPELDYNNILNIIRDLNSLYAKENGGSQDAVVDSEWALRENIFQLNDDDSTIKEILDYAKSHLCNNEEAVKTIFNKKLQIRLYEEQEIPRF